MTGNCVGKSIPRLDAMAKATGRAQYGDDLQYVDTVYAKGVYVTHPHANLLWVDTEAAKRLPGVLDVITAKDIPGHQKIGEVVVDQYVLVNDKSRFWGDVVAVVAAETPEAAQAGAQLVRAEYEPLPIYASPKAAYQGSIPVGEDYPNNRCVECFTRKGDVNAAFATADAVVETHYQTQHIEHAYIEPEVIVAVPSRLRPELTILGSIQNPYMVRLSVARTLGLPVSRVVVHPSTLGGSFGGKLESVEPLAVRAGLLALRLGRPVKYLLTREESIRESIKRHPIAFDLRMAATREGKIQALQVHAVGNGGPYVNMTPGIMWKTATLGPGPYVIPNLDYHSDAAMTNSSIGGSMRGFGTPQAILATENCLNELAQKLGLSPLEIRRQNLLGDGDVAPNGQTLDFHTVSIRSVMEKAAAEIGFEEKFFRYQAQPKTQVKRRGLGIACSMRGCSIGAEAAPDIGRVHIEVQQDGSVQLNCGFTEQGQGLYTCLSQITADLMGVPYELVSPSETCTDKSPLTGAAIASRGTFIGSAAIADAVQKIHEILRMGLEAQWKAPAGELVIQNGTVRCSGKELSFAEAVHICYQNGLTPAANGTFLAPQLDWNEKTGQGEAYYSYTYSCHMAEVEVDTETGLVELVKMVGSHDMGRAVNPLCVEGQIYGGTVMGAGMAMLEDLGHDPETGRLKHLNFEEYLIPTALDVGDIVPILDEHPDPRMTVGGRSIGEPSTEPGAAAVLGAINAAIGKAGSIRELPADLDKVFFACQAMREEA